MPHTMKHGFASTSDHDVAAYLSSLQALVEDQDIVGTTETQVLSNKTLDTPWIHDSGGTEHYKIAVSNLAADRTITLPLLTADDTFVFASFTQTLANKTLTTPKINDLTSSHQFNIITEELSASQDVTMRALTGADYFVFESLGQTLANKTLTTPIINTIYGGSAQGAELNLYASSHGSPTGHINMFQSLHMNGLAITGVLDPTSPQEAATKSYVDSAIQGLDWKADVLDYTSTRPGSPTQGQRYLIEPLGTHAIAAITTGTKTFSIDGDHAALFAANDIIAIYDSTTGNNGWYTVVSATFNTPNTDIVVSEVITSATVGSTMLAYGTTTDAWTTGTNAGPFSIAIRGASTWSYERPTIGCALYVQNEETLYTFATSYHWVQFGATVQHNTLVGLDGGTSGQYYHLSSADYTGTGTGVLVRTSSPTITTPTIAQINGGAAEAGNLTLQSTTHGTKGIVYVIGTLDMGSKKITNLLDPADNQDAATKKYVDDHSDTLWDRLGTVLYSQTGPGTDTIAAGSGAVGACGFSFYADQDCGFYYTATQVNVAVAGSQVGYFDANGLAVHSGVVGTPGIRFLSDVDCGFYYTATQINVAIAGVQVGVFSAGGYKAINGTAAAPSIALLNSTTTGFFRKGADQFGMTAAGAEIGYLGTSGIRMKDGTQAAPAYSFSSNVDCGFYLSSSSIYVSCDNTEVCNFNTSGLTMTTSKYILGTAGTAANPGFGFNDESSTGMYKAGPSTLCLTTGGTARLTVATYGIQVAPAGDVNAPSVQLGGNSDVGFFSNLYSSEDHFVALSIAAVEKFRVDEVCATFVDEVKVKLYAVDAPPDMENVGAFCFWKDTNDSNRIYLMYKRGTSDVVSVELTA